MKQYKTTIIALAVIAVVVAGFFIVSSILDKNPATPSASSPTADTTESEKVFDIADVSEIVGYECNIVDNIILQRNASEDWICTTYLDLTLNKSGINSNLNSIKSFMAVVVYEGEITSEITENYQISQSEYIKVKLANGTEYTLHFGMQKPGTSSYFAVVKETNKIYLVNDSYKKAITLTKENLLHTNIFSFSDSGKIKGFEILKYGKQFVSLTAELSDTTEEGRIWKMKYPLERAGADKHIEEIISAVISLYTYEYVEGDCTDLAKYGLDNPSYVLRLTDNKGTQSMVLGNKNPSGDKYYCTFGGENNVFLVDTKTLTFIDDSELKLMNTTIFSKTYTDLKNIKIDITCGDIQQSYTMGFDIWDDGEQLYFNGAALPDDNTVIKAFRKMNTALYSIDIVGLEAQPQDKGEKLISIQYEINDGTTVLVECYQRDESTMYIYENGQYTGGYEYIRQITGTSDNYGIAGTLENFQTVSGMK